MFEISPIISCTLVVNTYTEANPFFFCSDRAWITTASLIIIDSSYLLSMYVCL